MAGGRPAGRRAHRGLARPPLAPHARRGDGHRAARYPRLIDDAVARFLATPGALARRPRPLLRRSRCWLALALRRRRSLSGGVRGRERRGARERGARPRRSRRSAAATRCFPDQGLMVEARGRIPPDGAFHGCGRRAAGELERPRGPVALETTRGTSSCPDGRARRATWILCFACDRAAFPGPTPSGRTPKRARAPAGGAVTVRAITGLVGTEPGLRGARALSALRGSAASALGTSAAARRARLPARRRRVRGRLDGLLVVGVPFSGIGASSRRSSWGRRRLRRRAARASAVPHGSAAAPG